ncbi:UpxY family transcription antiterminator [Endozoicomonas sp. SM1973]|uniref:UpxY family transcription antiterminator n=1 Tax=Spartinivicinus marinus TaxID=2994442 RepID=A0A853IA94_9GAMM|nr:UpxY family transcription antiterminator [Spartinivicinus marinus]MCX4029645.1 UpxY family transcription antiterminator [Spartinivicinus marinus]NYZ66974.1 UpxY family transcription antiterminator [Spartinivicinus marinus]
MDHNNKRNWYAVYTRANCEAKLAVGLTDRNVEAFYPATEETRFWSDRKKKSKVPVFPSYIFVYINHDEFYQVKTTPGFSHFVSLKNEPTVIPESQISAVKQLMHSNYQWQAKTKTLSKGTPIEITEGPLQGYMGVLVADATQNNVAIEIPALCKAMVFTLKQYQFKPVWTG